MKIAVIIVGYNSKKYLSTCFESINKSSYKNFDIIFIDNNSKDKSITYLKEHFPETKCIQNEDNFGFAKGNNIGIKYAIKNGYSHVFLLNPDTIIDSRCLGILAKESKQIPNAILQPLILLHENNRKTNIINTDGNVLHFLGMSYCGNYKRNKQLAKSQNITIASGAAVMIPIETIKKIGLLDEDFFMYHEDVDLSWRAQQQNILIKLADKAIVWHKYSFNKNPLKLFYFERNRLQFLLKNFSIKYLLLITPILIANEIAVLLVSLLQGWLATKVKSYISLISLLPKITRKRRLHTTKINEADLKEKLISELNFKEVNIPLINLYNSLSKNYWLFVKRFI